MTKLDDRELAGISGGTELDQDNDRIKSPGGPCSCDPPDIIIFPGDPTNPVSTVGGGPPNTTIQQG